MISKKQKNFRVSRELSADFEKTCTLFEMKKTEAFMRLLFPKGREKEDSEKRKP